MKTNLEKKLNEIDQDFFKQDLIEETSRNEIKDMSDNESNIQKVVVNEQEKFSQLIREMAYKFRNVEDFVQLQVDMYSSRQNIVERKSFFNQLHNKLNKKLRSKKDKEFSNIKTKGHNNFLAKTSHEQNIILDGILNDIVSLISVISDHQQFLDSSLDTIDRMIFGFKHRIQIEEIKEKNTVGY